MKFRSIRSRLTFSIGSLVTLILALGSYIIYHTAHSTLYDEIDKNLNSVIALQSLEIEMKDGVVFHEWFYDILKDRSRSDHEYVQVWDEVTGDTTRSPALGGADLPRIGGADGLAEFVSFTLPDGHHGRAIGMQVIPEADPLEVSDSSAPQLLVVALDTEDAERALFRLAGTLLLGLVFSLFVSILAIRLIIAVSFRPMSRLEAVIQGINVNNPKDVFDVPRNLPSELKGAVVQYQKLLSRISRVREREREFSGNVSHELRTPLAGIEATLEQAVAVERDAEDYRKRIEVALSITSRMRDLVNRLMWFSRLYNNTDPLVIEAVDLHLLIETRLAVLEQDIAAKGLVLESHLLAHSVIIESDETLISILLNNLIGNAVAHSDPNTTVKLETKNQSNGICFEVSNVARDFKESELQRIFEPFYRSDRARSGEAAHSGIGLSLSYEIAQTLGLQLQARFEDASRFIIEVVFPEK